MRPYDALKHCHSEAARGYLGGRHGVYGGPEC